MKQGRDLKLDHYTIVNELLRVLHDHQCTVWEAEELFTDALRVIRATALIQEPGLIPYELPEKVSR